MTKKTKPTWDDSCIFMNKDEYIKGMFIMCSTLPEMLRDLLNEGKDDEAVITLCEAVKMLTSEYYNLVTNGKIEAPKYLFDKGDRNDTRKSFLEAVSSLNIALAKSGVPFTEDKKGRLSIDYEKMREELLEDEQN